jgi:hypothetical protein
MHTIAGVHAARLRRDAKRNHSQRGGSFTGFTSKIVYTIASSDQFREVAFMPLNRHRDATGPEERKRNDTLVGTLRAEYGEKFAPRFSEKMELGTLKERLGLPLDASLNDVLRHFKIKK